VFDVERHGDGTATVTIDRAEKLNAMDVEFFQTLPKVLDELDADPGVTACVLTGAGRAFSAGGDIDSFHTLTGVDAYRRHLRMVFDSFHSVERAETLVVGAINGIAYGGGTELTLACDMAIASDQARFAFKEPTMGLMPGFGVLRGPQQIGPAWTRRLATTGETIDARTAERIGLVQETVPHEELLDRARAIASRIAQHPHVAVRSAKHNINQHITAPGLAGAVEATALLFTTDGHKERVQAFLEERR
jgi:enoyl-CoA hydratase/carnithine racemase